MDGTTMKLSETPEEWQRRADAATARGVNKQFPLTVAVLWPTPNASDSPRSEASSALRSERGHQIDLPTAIALWPTVTVTGNHNRAGLSEKSGDGLATPLSRALWATPQAHDATGAPGAAARARGGFQRSLPAEVSARPTPSASLHNDAEDPASWLARAETLKAKHSNGNGAGMPLAVAAKLSEGLPWATPTARDHRSGRTSAATSDRNSRPLSEHVEYGTQTGSLNPAWVETLMGFPAGWTDIAGPQDAAKHRPRGSRRASRKGAPTDEHG